jgi:hypothetical protein
MGKIKPSFLPLTPLLAPSISFSVSSYTLSLYMKFILLNSNFNIKVRLAGRGIFKVNSGRFPTHKDLYAKL